MAKTKGQRALLAWANEDPKNRTQTYIAKKCGVRQSSVSAWFRGITRPEPEFREVLFTLAGIDPAHWLTKAEQSRRDEAIERIGNAETAANDDASKKRAAGGEG